MVNVAIIGAYGSAGVAAAEALLEAVDAGRLDDAHVHLIDDGDPGGLCILRGCMPSKDVISAAAHRYQVRTDDRLGQAPAVDLDAVVDRKDRHVADFAGHRADAIDAMGERDDVTVHEGTAKLLDEHTLAVAGEDLAFDYVVVATGSTPRIPSVPGLDDVTVRTSADVLEARSFPDSAVVIGFGHNGMELAPYMAEVGDTDVTVIDRNDRPLDDADPAYGDTIIDMYETDFDIAFHTGADVTAVESLGNGVEVRFETDDGQAGTAEGEALYAFAGRRPNLRGLGLRDAGIEPRRGWHRRTMQTDDADHVYIVGDANGREPILHVGKEEGIVAARNIVAQERGEELRRHRPTVHRVVFSGLAVYPYARVGHTPDTGTASDVETVTVTREATSDGVFRVKGVPHGLATLVVHADSGRVLGYQGLHHHADVFAKLAQVIVEGGLTVHELPDRAYHPTTPELLDGLLREATAAVVDR